MILYTKNALPITGGIIIAVYDSPNTGVFATQAHYSITLVPGGHPIIRFANGFPLQAVFYPSIDICLKEMSMNPASILPISDPNWVYMYNAIVLNCRQFQNLNQQVILP